MIWIGLFIGCAIGFGTFALLAINAENREIKQIKRLKGYLFEYGRHNPGCSGKYPDCRCRCGWRKIETKLKKSDHEAVQSQS